jgi:hypothetical protein
LFTSLVFLPPKDVGICGDLVFTKYSQILSNTLTQKYSIMMESFSSSQKYTRVEGIRRIFRDYPLKTQTRKQLIGEIPGYEIIHFHPLKYPRSKQGLNGKKQYGYKLVYLVKDQFLTKVKLLVKTLDKRPKARR